MAVPEEIQQAANEWYTKQEQLRQAGDRALMYLSRERAALVQQDVIGFAVAIITALFLGGPWPWADAWMWHTQYRRAWQRIRELEREQSAIEKEYHLIVVKKESEA